MTLYGFDPDVCEYCGEKGRIARFIEDGTTTVYQCIGCDFGIRVRSAQQSHEQERQPMADKKFDMDSMDAPKTSYPDIFQFDEPGDEVAGEITHMEENVGKYNQTVIHVDTGDETWSVFLNNTMLNGINSLELGEGDLVGIRLTDRTYENSFGEFPVYDVRGKKQN